jgi:hypothetical protein
MLRRGVVMGTSTEACNYWISTYSSRLVGMEGQLVCHTMWSINRLSSPMGLVDGIPVIEGRIVLVGGAS